MTGVGADVVACDERGSCAIQSRGWLQRPQKRLERKRYILRVKTSTLLGDLVSTWTHSSTAAAMMTDTRAGAGAGGERDSCTTQSRGCLWRAHRRLERKYTL